MYCGLRGGAAGGGTLPSAMVAAVHQQFCHLARAPCHCVQGSNVAFLSGLLLLLIAPAFVVLSCSRVVPRTPELSGLSSAKWATKICQQKMQTMRSNNVSQLQNTP